MAIKSDFDDAVEFALNEEKSEDIIASLMENEKIDEENAKQCLLGANPLVEPESIVQQVSEYLSDRH